MILTVIVAALSAGCGNTTRTASESQTTAPQTPATLDAGENSVAVEMTAPASASTTRDELNQAFMEQAGAANTLGGADDASPADQTERLNQIFGAQTE